MLRRLSLVKQAVLERVGRAEVTVDSEELSQIKQKLLDHRHYLQAIHKMLKARGDALARQESAARQQAFHISSLGQISVNSRPDAVPIAAIKAVDDAFSALGDALTMQEEKRSVLLDAYREATTELTRSIDEMRSCQKAISEQELQRRELDSLKTKLKSMEQRSGAENPRVGELYDSANASQHKYESTVAELKKSIRVCIAASSSVLRTCILKIVEIIVGDCASLIDSDKEKAEIAFGGSVSEETSSILKEACTTLKAQSDVEESEVVVAESGSGGGLRSSGTIPFVGEPSAPAPKSPSASKPAPTAESDVQASKEEGSGDENASNGDDDANDDES